MKSHFYYVLLLIPSYILADSITDCYGWPKQEFTPSNNANVVAVLPLKASPPSMSLSTPEGQAIDFVKDLLTSKNVAIMSCSYTCPVCERSVPQFLELAKTYSDKAHFVIVYNIEAHPKYPEVSPYSGETWNLSFSNFSQAMDYATRVEHAKYFKQFHDGLDGTVLLVDGLTQKADNPFWCTYGTNPNGGYYLRKEDQIIIASQPWINMTMMREVIETGEPVPQPTLSKECLNASLTACPHSQGMRGGKCESCLKDHHKTIVPHCPGVTKDQLFYTFCNF